MRCKIRAPTGCRRTRTDFPGASRPDGVVAGPGARGRHAQFQSAPAVEEKQRARLPPGYNLVAAYDAAHGRITKLKVLSWLLYNHLAESGQRDPPLVLRL